jgi:hypothetical protein
MSPPTSKKWFWLLLTATLKESLYRCSRWWFDSYMCSPPPKTSCIVRFFNVLIQIVLFSSSSRVLRFIIFWFSSSSPLIQPGDRFRNLSYWRRTFLWWGFFSCQRVYSKRAVGSNRRSKRKMNCDSSCSSMVECPPGWCPPIVERPPVWCLSMVKCPPVWCSSIVKFPPVWCPSMVECSPIWCSSMIECSSV